MATDETKRAAQEFLAAQFTEAVQIEEERLNSQAAVALAAKVWKRVAETFVAQCEAWNAITKQESLSCKETILGDLRIRCAGKPDIITVHYDSKKLQVILRNTARPDAARSCERLVKGSAIAMTMKSSDRSACAYPSPARPARAATS